MAEIYRFFADEKNMILWDTYMGIRYSPAKTTFTGFHYPCVMVSIGRTLKSKIDEKEVEKLPERAREKLFGKYKTDLNKFVKKSFKERIIEKVVSLFKSIGMLFGLSLDEYNDVRGERNIEIYQYLKLRDVDEAMQMVFAVGSAIGLLAKMKNASKNDVLNKGLKIFKKGFEYGYKSKYEVS